MMYAAILLLASQVSEPVDAPKIPEHPLGSSEWVLTLYRLDKYPRRGAEAYLRRCCGDKKAENKVKYSCYQVARAKCWPDLIDLAYQDLSNDSLIFGVVNIDNAGSCVGDFAKLYIEAMQEAGYYPTLLRLALTIRHGSGTEIEKGRRLVHLLHVGMTEKQAKA